MLILDDNIQQSIIRREIEKELQGSSWYGIRHRDGISVNSISGSYTFQYDNHNVRTVLKQVFIDSHEEWKSGTYFLEWFNQ